MRPGFDSPEWSQVYDESAPGADAYVFRRSSEMALETVRALREPGQRWLDLGCGPGHGIAQLAVAGPLVVGADSDRNMLHAARRRSGELALVAALAELLPFVDESLDGVAAVSLMGCLAAPETCFSEISRVLRPNGVAVMTFTNRASWLLKLNYRLPRRWITSAAAGQNKQQYRLYVAAEVRTALERSGLTVQRVTFYNHVLHVGRWLIPPRRLATRLDGSGCARLARNFLVVARKSRPVIAARAAAPTYRT